MKVPIFLEPVLANGTLLDVLQKLAVRAVAPAFRRQAPEVFV